LLHFGSIGCRNHASRIIQLVNASGIARVSHVFNPNRIPTSEELSGAIHAKRLNELLECQAIGILSPNSTHWSYISKLLEMGYSGYLFCEKPPVVNRSEWESLSTLENDRLFFDFNLRFSSFARAFRQTLEAGSIGEVIHAEAFLSHGLAFVKGFDQSWRANVETHARGVFESVAVHFVDLFGWLIGPVQSLEETPGNFAKKGTASDTCLLNLRHDGGSTSVIFASYSAPFAFRIAITGTNGMLVFEDGVTKLFSPRDTFDSRGYFQKPPAKEEFKAIGGDLFGESLGDSVRFFLEHCANFKSFPPEFFRASVNTNRWLI
jgi:predicted dehydrogenase